MRNQRPNISSTAYFVLASILFLSAGLSLHPAQAQNDPQNTKTVTTKKTSTSKSNGKSSSKKSSKKTTTTTTTETTEAIPTPTPYNPNTPEPYGTPTPTPAPTSTPAEENKNVMQKTGDAVDNAVKSAGEMIGDAAERRSSSNLIGLINYSPFDLLVTNKFGATVGWVQNANTTYELEYLRGSVSVPFVVQDVGSMTDQRVSLMRRSYFGSNSFNISYGVSYFDFTIHIGEALLNRASAGQIPSLDAVTMQSLGANFAIGNRWSFSQNITFGVDWFSWAQPLYTIKRESAFTQYSNNSNDRNDVDQAMKIISYFPRFAVLKVQLGIMF